MFIVRLSDLGNSSVHTHYSSSILSLRLMQLILTHHNMTSEDHHKTVSYHEQF